MKKTFILFSVLGLLLLAVPVATAVDRNFESSLVGYTSDSAGNVYIRYYSPADDGVNPQCAASCGTSGSLCDKTDPNMYYCRRTYTDRPTGRADGYRGYTENVKNFNAALEYGTRFYGVWDNQRTDAGRRAGYYAWVGGDIQAVNSSWDDPALNCAGTAINTCLGNGNPGNARDISGNAPGGALAKAVALSPIPVPLANDNDLDGNAYSVGGVKGTFELKWDAAFSPSNAEWKVLGYDLYFAKKAPQGKASCGTAGEAEFVFLQTVPGTETQAAIPYIAVDPDGTDEGSCVTFAIKLRYPGADGGSKAIISRYLSANGTAFLTGGLAANVYDLAAKFVGKNNVEVSWKTSLEDGVRGFYVTRSLTQNGTYTRVSDLIGANGEPSAYSFIDTLTKPTVPVKTTGLYYKVESVDIDDAVTPYGPVKVQMPTERNTVIQDRTKKAPRK